MENKTRKFDSDRQISVEFVINSYQTYQMRNSALIKAANVIGNDIGYV